MSRIRGENAGCARRSNAPAAMAVTRQHDGLRDPQSRVARPWRIGADLPGRPSARLSEFCAACFARVSPRTRDIAARAVCASAAGRSRRDRV
jgi:hypothetical protein